MKHIPYQGRAPALQALLAVTRSERFASHLDVPTFNEAGYEVIGDNMKGFVAPASIPDDVYAYLHEQFKKGLEALISRDYATKTRFTTEYLDGPALQNAMTTLLNEISAAVKK